MEIPTIAQELIGSYLPSAQLLGQRTGELHVALASDVKNPAFAPEPFTALYRRSLYQSMRTLADQSLALLGERIEVLPEEIRVDAEKVLKLESTIFNRFRQIIEAKIGGMRIRCHGDFHLGQVLSPARISSSPILKANLRARSPNGASSARRCGTSPVCYAPSITLW